MGMSGWRIRIVAGLGALGLTLMAVLALPRHRGGDTANGPEGRAPAEADGDDEQRLPAAGLPAERLARGGLPSRAPQDRSPLAYVLLVFALTIPVWLVGGGRLPIPVALPVSALAAVNPLLAACILTYRRDGLPGIRSLFGRVLDHRQVGNKVWYLPVLFLYPLIMVLSYGVMRLARRPLPDPHVAWLMAPVYLLAFFVAAIGEELGWMGYAIDPMQRRWGALKASIALGLVWAVFHLVPDLQNRQTAGWILWQRLGTVAFRILIVWVYNNAGKSVFAATLFHAVNNLSWALFPNNGSHYDPFVTFMLTLPVVGFVIIGWEPKTLARYRLGRRRAREEEHGRVAI